MYHTDTEAALDRDALFHDNVKLAGFFLDRITLPWFVERDDALQEALLGLHRAARYFDPSRGVKFSTFAGVCIRQYVHDFIKQCRAAAMPTHARQEALSDPADRAPGPEDVAALNELVTGVRDAVATLPDHARDVVERHLLSGQKAEAVARSAGVTRTCVYFRARSAERLLGRVAPALAHHVGVAGPAHPVAATLVSTPPEDSFAPVDYSGWPAMLTSERVADVVSISVRTLWRLVAKGQFPQPVRFNRKLVRWRKSDVVAWLEGGAG